MSKHSDEKKSVWITINTEVYDVTEFLGTHPGGSDNIMRFAGKDATVQFVGNHSQNAEKL